MIRSDLPRFLRLYSSQTVHASGPRRHHQMVLRFCFRSNFLLHQCQRPRNKRFGMVATVSLQWHYSACVLLPGLLFQIGHQTHSPRCYRNSRYSRHLSVVFHCSAQLRGKQGFSMRSFLHETNNSNNNTLMDGDHVHKLICTT